MGPRGGSQRVCGGSPRIEGVTTPAGSFDVGFGGVVYGEAS